MQSTAYPEDQFHNSAGLTEYGESLETVETCCPDKTDRSALVAGEFPRTTYQLVTCPSLNTVNASAQLSPCHIPALDLECLQPERKLHQGTQSNLVLGQSCSATAHFSTNAEDPCELLQAVKSSSITQWGLQRQGAVFNWEGQWELTLEAATAQPLAPT